MRFRWGTSLAPEEPVRTLSAELVRAAGELTPLPRWLLDHPLTAMSPGARQVAWAVGRRVTRNPDHGFAIASRVRPQAVGSLWETYRVAPTLAHLHRAYLLFARQLVDNMETRLLEDPSVVRIELTPETPLETDRAEEDFRAAMQVATWRALHPGTSIAPRAVYFTYARPRSTAAHEHVLGTTALHFEQPAFAMELERRWWDAPLAGADQAAFAAQLAQLTTEAAESMDCAQQVEALVTQLLSSDARAERVAELLGVSARTMHRRLIASGHTFRGLTERARQREAALVSQAEVLFGLRALSSVQWAKLLGFANGGALRNARKRWRAR